MSIDVFTLDDFDDTLLIGPSPAFLRVGPSAALSDHEIGRRLNRRLDHASTLGRLRGCFERWGLEFSGPMLLPSRLVDGVVEAVRRRHLAGYALPPVENVATLAADVDEARAAVTRIKPARLLREGAAPLQGRAPSPSLAALSLHERLAEVLDRTEALLSPRSGERYRRVFEPAFFIKSVAVLALWAGTPLITTAHVMAAVFRAGGAATPIRLVAERTADIADLMQGLRVARTDPAIDEAARRIALIIEAMGLDAFLDLMRVVPERVRSGAPPKEVYVYPPMRTIEPRLQARPGRDNAPPPPRSILPVASASPSPQVEALIAAARSGTPFCEECARAAAA